MKKFNFNFPQIITFIKESPEKIILWTLLATFIFLSSYLAIAWPKRRDPLPPEEIAIEGIHREAVDEAVISVDFGGLLVRKPITYYNDFVQRNPFARLPGVVGPRPNGGNDNRTPSPPIPGVGLICRGIVRNLEMVAFIEGREMTYVVMEGDEVEGWRVIKIDKEKVKLYNEEKKKEVILLLGGGAGEREGARRKDEESRRKMREGGRKKSIEEGPGDKMLLP